MNHPLPRFYRHTQAAQDAQTLAAILIEVGDPAPDPTPTHATPAGDERKLRGIPAIGRGVTGAIPGTSPHTLR